MTRNIAAMARNGNLMLIGLPCSEHSISVPAGRCETIIACMRLTLIASVLTLAASSVFAQINTGEIAGVVRDSSGGILPGAVVTATHDASGIVVERAADGDGRFFLAALRIGAWTVEARLAGLSPETYKVVLEVGRAVTLEFSLGVLALSEQIEVRQTIPLLQVATAEISDVIENRDVVQLPLNGRNFLALAQLSDAVVIPPGGTRGEALQQAGPLPNVGGQRSGHNIYLLDGTKVTDELFNNLVINPSVDSIEEFKIQKSMYAAEFGGKASALINVVTRAGANAFRGSVFEFHRDDAFDSPNYFRPVGEPVPPLRQDQFGGTLGGPLRRNRSFFFGSFEELRMKRSLTRTFSVPTSAVRAGNFAGLGSICDPLTISTTGSCVPFPNNQIPAGRIDSIAATLLQQVPAATSGGSTQNLTAVEEQDRHLNQFSVRVDHELTASDRLFARFSTFDGDETQPFGTSALQETLVPGFGRSLTTKTRNLVASHTRTFGTSLLNELRVGWMTVAGGQISQNRGNTFAQDVGLLGVTGDPRDMGFPQISTGGLYSTFGDPTIFTTRDNQHFEFFNNVTLARARHRLKFGAYYFHLQLRPEQPDNARGAFTYTGQFSGNAFADFLLGYPTSAVSGIGRGDENGRTNWLHLYVQDDWQPRSNLTFNLGLRYELNQHMYDVDNRLSSIDLDGRRFVIASDENGNIHSSAGALLDEIPISYVTSESAGWGRGLMDPSTVRLAPRAGFALTLNDARAVVRGGYGIFLNQWAYSVQTAFARNLPFFFTKQIDVPSDVRVPALQTRDILTSTATGTVGGSIMDYEYNVEYSQTWSGGLQVPALAIDGRRNLLHGHLDAWRGQRDRPERARARPGSDSGAAARSRAEPHQRHSLRRQVHLPRHDAEARASARPGLRLQHELYAVTVDGRRVEPRRHGVGSERAAERAQHLRRNRRMGVLELRPSAPVHPQRRVSPAVLRGSPRACTRAVRRLARQRDPHRAGGSAVHGQPRRGSRQHWRRTGSAPQSGGRSESARRRPHAGTMVRHGGFRFA